MADKTVIFGILTLLVLAGLGAWLFWPQPYYSDEPKDWTEPVPGGVSVDIEKATQGQSFDNGRNQYFLVNGTRTSFKHEGWYLGNYFEREYADAQGVRMRVGTELKPNDGVIDGVATERVRDGRYEVLIFLDEDWRRQLPQTNIVWGVGYQRAKPFLFTEVGDGTYLEIIEDDPGRFGDNHRTSYYGIVVGDVTQADVKAGITEGRTLLMFQ